MVAAISANSMKPSVNLQSNTIATTTKCKYNYVHNLHILTYEHTYNMSNGNATPTKLFTFLTYKINNIRTKPTIAKNVAFFINKIFHTRQTSLTP